MCRAASNDRSSGNSSHAPTATWGGVLEVLHETRMPANVCAGYIYQCLNCIVYAAHTTALMLHSHRPSATQQRLHKQNGHTAAAAAASKAMGAS